MALFEQPKQRVPSNLLQNKFGWPPFSILNTISWDWQRRKDEWENLYHTSTVGRDVKRNNATPTNTFSARGSAAKEAESISEFDPFLCELMYKWFSLPNMRVLDPFAGGCVRGLVASVLGRHYVGIDLSKPQIDTNISQYTEVINKYTDISGSANWILGDSDEVLLDKFGIKDFAHLGQYQFDYDNPSNLILDNPSTVNAEFVKGEKIPNPQTLPTQNKFDFIFTCPPYYNLEKYSTDIRDLSRAPSYGDFLDKYRSILYKASLLLNDNSFFVIVVSEIRASSQDIGNSQYLGLVPDTIRILKEDCSLLYYNEVILENAIGSLPIRAPKYFNKTRKIGRHHQNILIFYKGDINAIENKFGKIVF